MSQFLFNRSWSVSLGPPGKLTYVYTDLRTVFDVERYSNGSSPSKCKIEVYNLNSKSRQIFQKNYEIILQAGYVGNDKDTPPLLGTIFFGQILKHKTKRQGADIVTEFECGGSEKEIGTNVINQTFGEKKPLYQVLEVLAKAMGVPIGPVAGINDFVYNSGLTLSGKVSDQLTTICNDNGLNWSIQNGVLQIIPQDKHRGDTAVVLSNKIGGGYPGLTGLIGVPSLDGDICTFKSLLNPKIQVDAVVQLVSDSVNGFFKVKSLKFHGDSHGDKWDVECEASKINAVQSIPFASGLDFRGAVVV